MVGVGESEPEILDEQAFFLGLQDVRTRDEVGSLLLRYAEGLLSRAASKGVIPKKRARRHISRLAKRSHEVSSS